MAYNPEGFSIDDVMPPSDADLDRLDSLLFDIDTHAQHINERRIFHDFVASDYDHFDEETYTPFEVKVWQRDVAGLEVYQAAVLELIDEDVYVSTLGIEDNSEHELMVLGVRKAVAEWRSILPRDQAAWLDTVLDLVQNPEEADTYIEQAIETAPYTVELGTISNLRHITKGKTALTYSRVVGNDKYASDQDIHRPLGTSVELLHHAQDGLWKYDYLDTPDEGRQLTVASLGTHRKTRQPNSPSSLLTSGLVRKLCVGLEEVAQDLGPAKFPFA